MSLLSFIAPALLVIVSRTLELAFRHFPPFLVSQGGEKTEERHNIRPSALFFDTVALDPQHQNVTMLQTLWIEYLDHKTQTKPFRLVLDFLCSSGRLHKVQRSEKSLQLNEASLKLSVKSRFEEKEVSRHYSTRGIRKT